MAYPHLLILSDTHGQIPALRAVIAWAGDRSFDAAVFLGDGAEDLGALESSLGLPWKKVRGNGDYDFSIPETDILDIGSRRLFLAHGHRYALYDGYDLLIAAARNRGAEAALFGHTHIPLLNTEGGILLINPGSTGRPRSRIGPSFATLECPPREALTVRFWGLKENYRGIQVQDITGLVH